MTSLLVVVAVAVLIWQMTFLFTTEYVKIRLQLQILCQCVFFNDIHSRPPCLNSNLEETLFVAVFSSKNPDILNLSLSLPKTL